MEPKKNPKIDLSKKVGLFLNIGMAISILSVTVAFEWRKYDDTGISDLGKLDDEIEDILEIPPTEIPPPPPPKVQIPEIIEVDDEEEIEDEIEINLDADINEETVVDEIVFDEAPEDENADEIFEIVEESASFPGGYGAFRKYLKDNLKYPRRAKSMGTEGKVFVQFIVERDGSLTDIHFIRGIGSGCDEEAERVLKNSPKWSPGKQRGVPVRQKMVQLITFKLSN